MTQATSLLWHFPLQFLAQNRRLFLFLSTCKLPLLRCTCSLRTAYACCLTSVLLLFELLLLQTLWLHYQFCKTSLLYMCSSGCVTMLLAASVLLAALSSVRYWRRASLGRKALNSFKHEVVHDGTWASVPKQSEQGVESPRRAEACKAARRRRARADTASGPRVWTT